PSVEERPEAHRHSMKGAAPPTSLPAEPSPLETALRSLPASVSRSWKRDELLGTMQSVPDAAHAEPPRLEPPRPEPPRPEPSAPDPSHAEPRAVAHERGGGLVLAPGVIAD